MRFNSLFIPIHVSRDLLLRDFLYFVAHSAILVLLTIFYWREWSSCHFLSEVAENRDDPQMHCFFVHLISLKLQVWTPSLASAYFFVLMITLPLLNLYNHNWKIVKWFCEWNFYTCSNTQFGASIPWTAPRWQGYSTGDLKALYCFETKVRTMDGWSI